MLHLPDFQQQMKVSPHDRASGDRGTVETIRSEGQPDISRFRRARGRSARAPGENGAGKSTLVKMTMGWFARTAARCGCAANPHVPPKPGMARQLGVAMVFQHFRCSSALTVAENVTLGMENLPKMGELAGSHPVGQARNTACRSIPTGWWATLGRRRRAARSSAWVEAADHGRADQRPDPQEVEIPFQTLRQLSAEGTAILISHKLEGKSGALRRRHHPAARQGGGDLHPAREDRTGAGRK